MFERELRSLQPTESEPIAKLSKTNALQTNEEMLFSGNCFKQEVGFLGSALCGKTDKQGEERERAMERAGTSFNAGKNNKQ